MTRLVGFFFTKANYKNKNAMTEIATERNGHEKNTVRNERYGTCTSDAGSNRVRDPSRQLNV